MVNNARCRRTIQRFNGKTHTARVAIRETGRVTTIRYGQNLPTDDELKLCGTLGSGKRALELGISHHHNSIVFAQREAKAIAVDPDADRITALRHAATEHEVHVECHHADLADLGFITSASLELVIADHSLSNVDDMARLFRQVHRVLRPSRPFVIAIPHPFAAVQPDRSSPIPYGTTCWTVSEWFTYLYRANFRIDQMIELGVSDTSALPTTLILRAVTEGD